MSKSSSFQTIQFSISTQFNSIQSIDRSLSGATTLGQSGPESDDNDGVLCIPQSFSVTEASPSDYLVLYPRHSLEKSYPSTVMQSVYSTALANRANKNWIQWIVRIIFRSLFCIQILNRHYYLNFLQTLSFEYSKTNLLLNSEKKKIKRFISENCTISRDFSVRIKILNFVVNTIDPSYSRLSICGFLKFLKKFLKSPQKVKPEFVLR